MVAPQPVIRPATHAPTPGLNVSAAIRDLRQQQGLSQRQLAQRMQVPRTYVSKIENEKATPTLSSLERLAEALRVTVVDLLTHKGGQDPVRDLVADEFISELIPYLKVLNGMQWQSVMTQLRDLSTRPRRTA